MTFGTGEGGAIVAPIIAALESHLAQLDELGAHIAAAYLDAAIQHLRVTDV
ncbi:hypothetical protein P7228_13460 [Altererythrobacter arenosus]|uniref:Uncharacterized protein n=1 Tax=Altererythrobacter arenosus TaxID=3032592 RepID=A0ABY8FQD8_9SPHN|nr:hypothetical protein [Altererythrobacter sp. CAU 1644]WFL76987.1 hypothetical protein P7228_13460 [Altererythrobacter sp. CAU 1644]